MEGKKKRKRDTRKTKKTSDEFEERQLHTLVRAVSDVIQVGEKKRRNKGHTQPGWMGLQQTGYYQKKHKLKSIGIVRVITFRTHGVQEKETSKENRRTNAYSSKVKGGAHSRQCGVGLQS